MGVYLTIRSATVEQIAALDAKPELLPAFFDAIGFEDVIPRPTLWQLLTGKRASIPEALLDQSNCMEIGLEKTWHALHFLFTGTAEGGDPPACFLMSGGLGLSTGDTEAHALSPLQVEAFRRFVHGISEEQLRARYDPKRMTELHIYPEIIWQRDGEEALEYVLEYHQQLWSFLRDAAAEHQGCVMWLG
ncbi:MAG TPA: YfbM family protein [Thermoanaerobaculia bacterium]|nr:YfbM family protein [Thermoanaerobaculia bacterium]